ncbi:RraA family protein [Aeromicrobium sp. YIM 150415]|nr:RraA family protein [Aeromicrobium sp. YIM 150415]
MRATTGADWWNALDAADRALSTATLHEAAGRIGALPFSIKPVSPSARVFGPAYPVSCTPGHNLWLHHAVYAAPAGAVLVVDVGAGAEFGYWGEILSVAAMAQGLGGLVINGCVRDSDQLPEVGFPVFSAGLCIRGTGKDPKGAGSLGSPICVGEVTVSSGDLVVGDADGVVVIPEGRVAPVIEASHARERDEAEYMDRLRAGERTVDIYDLPAVAGSPGGL